MGADFHFLQNGLRENFDITNIIPPLSFGQIFHQFAVRLAARRRVVCRIRLSHDGRLERGVGRRVDWINTNVRVQRRASGYQPELKRGEPERRTVCLLFNERIQTEHRLEAERGIRLCPMSAVAYGALRRRHVPRPVAKRIHTRDRQRRVEAGTRFPNRRGPVVRVR